MPMPTLLSLRNQREEPTLRGRHRRKPLLEHPPPLAFRYAALDIAIESVRRVSCPRSSADANRITEAADCLACLLEMLLSST